MTEPANVEEQMVGELDRRRADEAEALASLASMTADERKDAGLDDGPAEDLRQEAKRRTGRRRPSADDLAAAAEGLPEEDRQAVTDAVPDPDDHDAQEATT